MGKCDMLTAQKAEVDASKSMLQQQLTQLEQQLKHHESSSSTMRVSRDKLQAQKLETVVAKTAIELQVKDLLEEVSRLRSERAAMQPEIEQLKQFSELKHNYNKARYQLLTVCDELKLRMRQIEHDLSRELNAAKSAGKSSYPNEQARLNLKLARNLTEDIVRECDILGGTLTEEQLQSLAQDTSHFGDDTSQLKKDLAAKQSEASEMKLGLSQAQGQIATLKASLATTESQMKLMEQQQHTVLNTSGESNVGDGKDTSALQDELQKREGEIKRLTNSLKVATYEVERHKQKASRMQMQSQNN